jgi:ACS family tartrate transporter-like MFS transporter
MASAPTAVAVPYVDAQQTLCQSALRKNAWRMLPLLTLAFIFNYIDRTSVGFAALTMNKELGLTATEFGYGAGILFAGYALFEIPSNLAMVRFGARKWLARIMITWGFAAAATAFAQGPLSFYALRFLLGVAEAGFSPGVVFLLGAWFPAQYRTRVLAFFMLGVPLSSVIGGPMSVSLLQLDGLLGRAGWQWMFMIEGIPAVLIGVAVLLGLRDHPRDASWLSVEERDALIDMLAKEPRDKPRQTLLAALRDPRVLLLAAIQFGFVLGAYGIGIWLPQILKGHGLATVRIGYVSTIPYVAAVVGMIVWARHVDRSGRKILHLMAACLLGALGLALSTISKDVVAEMAGISLAVLAVSTARAIFWTIPTRFLTGVAAAGGLAFINSIGSFAGFVGPSMVGVIKEATGSFTIGVLAMALILVGSALLTAMLQLFVKKE